MNIKIALIGGIVFYVVQFILGFVTAPFIHEGVLEPLYQQTASFWRPELMKEPPDMAALMPRWIIVGVLMSIIMAAIYSLIRMSFKGSGLIKGVKYGVVLVLLTACWSAGWSGVFNLPEMIWVWWTIESIIYFIIGGAVLGWISEKLVPES